MIIKDLDSHGEVEAGEEGQGQTGSHDEFQTTPGHRVTHHLRKRGQEKEERDKSLKKHLGIRNGSFLNVLSLTNHRQNVVTSKVSAS